MTTARCFIIAFSCLAFSHPLCRAESYPHFFDLATSPSVWFIEYPHSEGEDPNIFHYDAPTTLSLDYGVYLINTSTTGTIWRDGHTIGITHPDQLYLLQVGHYNSKTHDPNKSWFIYCSSGAKASETATSSAYVRVTMENFQSWKTGCTSQAYGSPPFPLPSESYCSNKSFMYPGLFYKADLYAVAPHWYPGGVGATTSYARITYKINDDQSGGASVTGLPAGDTKTVFFAGPPLPDLDSPRNGDWWILF